MTALVYAITKCPEAAGFFQQLGRLNTSELVNNLPGYFDTPTGSSTGIHQTIFEPNESIPQMQSPWEGRICNQTESFRKADGTPDTNKGYQEVLRRGRNSEDFECSQERFVELSTKKDKITCKGMQEAITALQLQADGTISNVRRDPIAAENGISGFDFLMNGQNSETHLEIKSVDSAIKLVEK